MQQFPPQPQWGGPQQQPSTQYPQQQSMYQPPMQPAQQPPKKPWYRSPLGIGCLIALGAFLLCGVIGAIGNAARGTSPSGTPDTANIGAVQPASTPVPTQKAVPTHALKWVTTHTFSGNGSKKTGTFTVGNDWRIAWSCNHSSFSGMDYNVIIFVYNSDGGLADSGVNSSCTKTNLHDVTEIHTGGQVYLSIISEGDWTIAVQELR